MEIIYGEARKKDGFVIIKPPKNIRQIGSPGGRHKIYVEDYVHTFLHSGAFWTDGGKRLAVLIGKSEISMDIRYSFVSGAISCGDLVLRDGEIVFDEGCWETIYKGMKECFDGLEVLGWFLEDDGGELVAANIEAAHRKYFMGKDKILFLLDLENEDRVYTFEQGLLQKKEGYYIYYEKNLPMQEYMVSVREKLQRKTVGESGQDVGFGEFVGGGQLGSANLYERIGGVRQGEVVTEAEAALQGYRSMLLEKSTIKGKRKRAFLYTAASAAMVALCVLGITSINNYEKMREVEQALSSLTQNLEEEVPAGVIIDSVPSDLGNQQVEGAPNTDDGSEDEKQEFEIIPEQSEEPEQGEQGEPQGAVQGEPVVQVDTVNSSGQGEPPVQVSTVDSAGQGEPPVHVDTVNSAGQGEQPVQVATVNSAGQGEPAVQVATANSAGQGELAVQVATVNSSVQTYLDQGYYIVEAGDKLELICRRIYNTTAIMDKICELNHIKNVDKITIGQKILLP